MAGLTISAISLRIRPRPKAEAYLRLRTLPAEQAQIDWGHFGTLTIGRARRPLLAFVMVAHWMMRSLIASSSDLQVRANNYDPKERPLSSLVRPASTPSSSGFGLEIASGFIGIFSADALGSLWCKNHTFFPCSSTCAFAASSA